MRLDEAEEILKNNGYLVESVDSKQLLQDYIDCLGGRGFDVELDGTMLVINGEEVRNLGGYNVAYQIFLIGEELASRGFFD